jgi:RNA polymerase sigma-70 factor (ECF subfamily)
VNDFEELVARAQRGDRSAETVLCQRLTPAIRAFGRRRVGSADILRDFQQDVLLHFVEALRRGAVEDPARVPGFVLGICRNVARDRARRRERRDALWDMFGADVAQFDPLEPQNAAVDIMRLEDCLIALSQRARDAIRLAYGELKGHAEIAAHLQISESNARVLRHRTLHALRECMTSPASWEVA